MCFCAGYGVMSRFMGVSSVTVPPVVGLPLSRALYCLSERQLFGHVIAEQEDADIAEGTVVGQIPGQGTVLKARQAVGLTIIKKPAVMRAPAWVGQPLADIRAQAHARGIKLKEHVLPGDSTAFSGCYAQYPMPNGDVPDGVVHVYMLSPQADIRLVPSLTALPFGEAERILGEKGVELKIFHLGGSDDQRGRVGQELQVIRAQNPAPGELIDKNKLRRIYVQVGSGSPAQ